MNNSEYSDIDTIETRHIYHAVTDYQNIKIFRKQVDESIDRGRTSHNIMISLLETYPDINILDITPYELFGILKRKTIPFIYYILCKFTHIDFHYMRKSSYFPEFQQYCHLDISFDNDGFIYISDVEKFKEDFIRRYSKELLDKFEIRKNNLNMDYIFIDDEA